MPSVDPSFLGELPAPLWFIEIFKVLGFILHCIPMNLWLSGLPIALLCFLAGGGNAKMFATRFMKQLPFLMAFGINLGIVPLLFIQVAYFKPFYSSTVLMAWHWLGILILVLPAYYLLYILSGMAESGRKWLPILLGVLASCFLIGAGLIFTSAWSLMASPDKWPGIWHIHSIAGAATGLGTNWNDPVVYLRFISMCGLAVMTLIFWIHFDAYFLMNEKKGKKRAAKAAVEEEAEPEKPELSLGSQITLGGANKASQNITDFMDNPNLSAKEKKRLRKLRDAGRLSEEEELKAMEYGFDDDSGDVSSEKTASRPAKKASKPELPLSDLDVYRKWLMSVSTALVWFGFFIGGGTLWFYYFKVLARDTPKMDFLFHSEARCLPILTLLSITLFLAVFFFGRFKKLEGKLFVTLLGVTDLMTLSFFAVTRQLIQNVQLESYLDLTQLRTNIQWMPMIIFLLVFASGAMVIAWMVSAMSKTVKK